MKITFQRNGTSKDNWTGHDSASYVIRVIRDGKFRGHVCWTELRKVTGIRLKRDEQVTVSVKVGRKSAYKP